MSLSVAQMVKNLPVMQEARVQSPSWEEPLEKDMADALQFSGLENPHGQRSLVDCSPWGHKKSDMTE